jgi:hypothetical protein
MRRSSLSALLAVVFLAQSVHAQDVAQQGQTLLRLDAVDASRSPQNELVLYASFLDKYRKAITATDPHAWKVQIDGNEIEPEEITVKRLADSDEGVSVVFVLGATAALQEEWFEDARRGASNLLRGLGKADRSAVVTYSQSLDTSKSLGPGHGDSVTWLEGQKTDGLQPFLYDAVKKGLDFFPNDYESIGPNRVLVVFSDGLDVNMEKGTQFKDTLLDIQRLAKKRNVRIDVIAATGALFDPADQQSQKAVQGLQSISSYTGGTYRPAESAAAVEALFGHLQSELKDQHVIHLKPKKFDGNKDCTVTVTVEQDGQSYTSVNPVITFIQNRERHLLKWVLVGAGALVGVLLLFFIIRLIVRLIRSRRDDEVVEEGPDLTACPQCSNMIPPDWKVCQYCEALPHKGRLTVVSVGELNGRTFFLKDSLSNIGSATSNTIVLIDKSVSKRHAGIKIQDNRFELADFGSTNGVMVNGQRITKQFLKSKDLITIGAVELEFTLK